MYHYWYRKIKTTAIRFTAALLVYNT